MESSLWLLEGSGWVECRTGQGWPVELGHEQAKLESLATAAGLCRRRALTWAWRVWQWHSEVEEAQTVEAMPRMRWRWRGGEEAGDEESGIVVVECTVWPGCKQWCAVCRQKKAVCSMRGSVMKRDSETHHPCRSRRAIKAHQCWGKVVVVCERDKRRYMGM